MEIFPPSLPVSGEKDREISGTAIEPPSGWIALLFGPGLKILYGEGS
jgi:hypothetical protein